MPLRSKSGFTLVETLVATVLFAVLVTAIFRGIVLMTRSSQRLAQMGGDAPADMAKLFDQFADFHRSRTARTGPALQPINKGAWSGVAGGPYQACSDLVVVHNVSYVHGTVTMPTTETVTYQTMCNSTALPVGVVLHPELRCEGAANLRVTRVLALVGAVPTVVDYPPSDGLWRGTAFCFRFNAARNELMLEASGVFRSSMANNTAQTMRRFEQKRLFSSVTSPGMELTGPATSQK